MNNKLHEKVRTIVTSTTKTNKERRERMEAIVSGVFTLPATQIMEFYNIYENELNELLAEEIQYSGEVPFELDADDPLFLEYNNRKQVVSWAIRHLVNHDLEHGNLEITTKEQYLTDILKRYPTFAQLCEVLDNPHDLEHIETQDEQDVYNELAEAKAVELYALWSYVCMDDLDYEYTFTNYVDTRGWR